MGCATSVPVDSSPRYRRVAIDAGVASALPRIHVDTELETNCVLSAEVAAKQPSLAPCSSTAAPSDDSRSEYNGYLVGEPSDEAIALRYASRLHVARTNGVTADLDQFADEIAEAESAPPCVRAQTRVREWLTLTASLGGCTPSVAAAENDTDCPDWLPCDAAARPLTVAVLALHTARLRAIINPNENSQFPPNYIT